MGGAARSASASRSDAARLRPSADFFHNIHLTVLDILFKLAGRPPQSIFAMRLSTKRKYGENRLEYCANCQARATCGDTLAGQPQLHSAPAAIARVGMPSEDSVI